MHAEYTLFILLPWEFPNFSFERLLSMQSFDYYNEELQNSNQ